MASAMPPNCLMRASRPHFGRRLMPAFFRYGTRIKHCTITAVVVPRPSSMMCGSATGVGSCGSRRPGKKRYASRTLMEMMLLTTGAQAPGPKIFLVFRTAWKRAKRP